MDWVDEYATTARGQAEFVVQYGYFASPRRRANVEATQMLGFDEFQELLRTADVLVTPGPTTIMEALRVRTARHLCPARSRPRRARRQQPGRRRPPLASEEERSTSPTTATSSSRCSTRRSTNPSTTASTRPTCPSRRASRRIAAVVDALVWGTGDPGMTASRRHAVDARPLIGMPRWEPHTRTARGSGPTGRSSVICAGMPLAFLIGIHGFVWVLPVAGVRSAAAAAARADSSSRGRCIPLLLLVAVDPGPDAATARSASSRSRPSGGWSSRRRSSAASGS